MSLLTVSEILQPCIKQDWAVGAYDVVDIPMCQGVLSAAEIDKAPVILMVYPKSVSANQFKPLVDFIKHEVHKRGVVAAVALDHCTDLELIRYSIDMGFTGVMIDGSMLSFEENLRLSKKVVELAAPYNVSVEAELGHVGEGDELLTDQLRSSLFTSPSQAKEFIDSSGIDELAIAIGTAHGVYKFEPNLDLELLKEIRSVTDVGLVLHGSSGTPENQLISAIKTGIDKLNVYTDIRLEVIKDIDNLLKENEVLELDIIDLHKVVRESTCRVVREKNALFNSINKQNVYL